MSADRPGFIVNRILMPFLAEAMRAYEEGLGTAEDIDTGAKVGLNHPMGPLELADFIGLDVCLGIMRVLEDGFGQPQFAPPRVLVDLVEAGNLGQKTGRGFHTYPRCRRVPRVRQVPDRPGRARAPSPRATCTSNGFATTVTPVSSANRTRSCDPGSPLMTTNRSRERGPGRDGALVQLDAAHARHVLVGEDRVDVGRFDDLERGGPVGRVHDPHPVPFEDPDEHRPDRFLVVAHEDRRARGSAVRRCRGRHGRRLGEAVGAATGRARRSRPPASSRSTRRVPPTSLDRPITARQQRRVVGRRERPPAVGRQPRPGSGPARSVASRRSGPRPPRGRSPRARRASRGARRCSCRSRDRSVSTVGQARRPCCART